MYIYNSVSISLYISIYLYMFCIENYQNLREFAHFKFPIPFWAKVPSASLPHMAPTVYLSVAL